MDRVFCPGASLSKLRPGFHREPKRRAIDRWHDFENEATDHALREWCKDQRIKIED